MISKSSSDRLAIAAEQNIKEREYWLEKLSGDLIKSSFPYDYKHGSQTSPAAGTATVTVPFPPRLFEIVTGLSGGIDIKLHMILVTGLFVLLHKYSGNKDIIIGSPILKQEFDGEFINTVLVFRNEVDGNAGFKELLLQIRKTIIDANEHQNYPMEILAEQLNVPVNAGEFPLADVVVLLEGIHDKRYLADVVYDMLFVFGQRAGEILLSVEYDKSLYRESTVKQIIHHYLRLLEQLPADVNLPVNRVRLLSEQERKQVLIDFNDLEADYPRDKTLHRLFEEQVERTPDAAAVIGEDKENGCRVPITYGELNRRAGIIAGVLQEKGVAPDTIVAIMTDPSIEMFVGLLGILKAGGAYLPILPELPEERIEFMLKDSNAGILVSELSKLSGLSKDIEVIDLKATLLTHPTHLTHLTHPTHLSYIIYTSGTTGKPKGVMVEHRNVVAYLYSFFREFDITGDDTVIQLSTYSFDAFVEEVFPVLVKGGKIVIPDDSDIPDIESLVRSIAEYRVTIVDCSPLLLNEFNKLTLKSTTSEANPLAGVRLFISGGDVLKAEYVSNLLNTGTVYNTYGPTETTVCAAYYKCRVPLSSDVPIGKPIANYNVYVLDGENEPVPIGVTGEICISGSGIARGYLNRPELTVNMFGPGGAPSLSTPLYHSGDLGRWLPDGNIEFLGRADQQVKIRGYRIELGEIEMLLVKHPGVQEAVVAVREYEDGDKYLCAYFVPHSPHSPHSPQLREFLSRSLPGYMIPSHFEEIDKIPLTVSGKIDRDALPVPQVLEKQKYKAPTGIVEKKLAAIWSEVLNLEEEKIGTRSDFFEIGGHSLRATILISRIHKDFNVKVPLGDFFSNPTIEGTAAYIESAKEDLYTSIEPAEKKEYYALSAAQKRVFTMQQLNKDGITFNIPMVMVLEGEIVRERFETAFREVFHRHESFRTSFHVVDREPVQFIHTDVDFQVKVTGGAGRPAPSPGHVKTVISEFIRPFDLSRAPLLRVGLIRENQTRHILMVDMHHIVSDAVSMPLLIIDFAALYQGDSLSPAAVHYKDYAAWQRSPYRSRLMAGPRDYWMEQFAGKIPILEMPTDYPRPAVMKFEGRHILFEIDEIQTAALRTLASEQDATMYMVLLSIFYILLAKYSGQRDIVIGSPVAGRNHADLENIIGFFINVLPMRNFPESSKNFSEFLIEVRGNTLSAFENQDYPFDELVEELRPPRDTGRNPLYDVVFTVLNLEVPRVEIPGLKLSGREAEGSNVKTDLRIAAAEDETNIQLVLSYSTALFKEDTAQRMVKRFLDVTRQVIENPQVLIKDISIADEIVTIKTGAQRSDEEEFEF